MPRYKTYTSRPAMAADGYQFFDPPQLGACPRQCGSRVEWIKTPSGKNLALIPGTAHSHFDSCPGQSQASAQPPGNGQRASASPAPTSFMPSRELAPNNVNALAAQQLVRALQDCATAVRELTSELQQRPTRSEVPPRR